MRIVHTSDWHLGRTLHGVDLLDHQAAYLDHLVELVGAERTDAVLVAGDVYDRAIPPVEAVALLSDAVRRLAEHTQVVLTPGNHDSAVRLGFGAQLMRPEVHIRATVPGIASPVVVPGASGEGGALVYALPYLDPDGCRGALTEPDGERPARSHEAVMSAALRRVSADLAARRATAGAARPAAVVMGHAFVVGGQASESERDIRVGGVDSVPAGVFGGIGLDYVALGHLHGPQVVSVPVPDGADPAPLARYSGSPLAYSFSEMHQRKSTVVLDLGPGCASAELVPAPVPRRLADLVGALDDLLGVAGDPHTDDWLRVVVTDQTRPTDLVSRVKHRFPHALQIQHRPAVPLDREAIVVRAAADPLEVAHEFVEHVTGTQPTARESAALRDALELVHAAERSA